ncbi:MAG: AMP-binding protein, partial [bacterium]|nr:AMP-binding protein [bacterium]
MQNHTSFENLTPLTFLERAASVYANKPAVVYRDRVHSYAEFHQRTRRLAAALRQAGIGRGDRVAILAPNIPAMLEASFAPLEIGAALVTLNIRLSSREIAYILNHSGAKLLLFDTDFAGIVRGLA